jgi:protein TonB
MTVELLSFGAGIILLVLAAVGGGFEAREIKFPPLSRTSRFLSLVAGIALMVIGLQLREPFTGPGQLSPPGQTPEPTVRPDGRGLPSVEPLPEPAHPRQADAPSFPNSPKKRGEVVTQPGADPPVEPITEKPVRVDGNMAPTKVHHVPPVYPSAAREARIQGLVIIEAVIDRQGRVVEAKVLQGPEILRGAALEAVNQWRFTPTQLTGQPVPVIMTVTVNFVLQ